MREIKFRAFDTVNRQMVAVRTIDFDEVGEVEEVNTSTYVWSQNANPPNLDKLILMQFTGLHDKDGKEIYADDIVSAEVEQTIGDNITVNGVIEWDSSGWWCIDFPQLGQGIGIAGAVEMSVIGNYHENADLLDDK